MSKAVSKYGAHWPVEYTDLQIEMCCIQQGGRWKMGDYECGAGLSHHYERMRRLLWPELDDHKWHRLTRDEILKNKITVLAGCASSGKTHAPSWIYLCEYFCFPEETCVLVSSTDIRGLKLRVWGEITMLWEKARDRYPDLPGHLLDSKIAISTDSVEDGDIGERTVRDMRKGIVGIPCVQGGKFVGLSKYQGIKQKRMRLIGDELSAMASSFLTAFSNLNQNEDFRATLCGNFNDPLDPLGKAAEPIDGWENHLEVEKTSVWDTTFMGGRCVNLVGLDNPNMDVPEDKPIPYKYFPTRAKIAQVQRTFGKDSFEYFSMCVGTMKISTIEKTVLNRTLCRKFHCSDEVVWEGSEITKICGLDAAYGGDRCVGGHISFGKNVDGRVVIRCSMPSIIPISIRQDALPAEDQIAVWVREYCTNNDISPRNFFHDATGRGSLGTALARVWSDQTNPIDFGGPPTERPVHQGLFIFDERTRVRRLKTCSEHYDRFVSELWYAVRYTVEADQLRNLPDEVRDEFCRRYWDRPAHNKTVLETKIKMKDRIGFSPDLADWLSICVEGARQRGFIIDKLGNDSESTKGDDDFFKQEAEEYQRAIKSRLLKHA